MDRRKDWKNKRKFENWEELPNGGRRYWYDVKGRFGRFARYVKEVNASEKTTQFYQEIYNEKNELIEIHLKYPKDEGHRKVLEE